MKKTNKKSVPFQIPTKDVDVLMKKIGAKRALIIMSNGDMTAIAKLWEKNDEAVFELIQAIQSVLEVIRVQSLSIRTTPVSKSTSRRVAVQKKAVKKAMKKVPAKKK